MQRFLYRREPNIAHKWRTTFEEEGRQYHEDASISQRGKWVTGQLELRENGDTTIYKFSGTFQHLILTCTYESTDPRDYERGSFTLKYFRGMFRGQHILLSRSSDQPISSEYDWTAVD
ncbi:MAG: hypothetical protein HY220_04425 [Candidatus Sungbacteria bacterium]|uniref:Uncharacterized protein n=1 Tax=Candidatus Sungiibacteriota bacterium TaxID=2750080 RepID=A0A9D6QZ25_9BACT|nr:hypothetical protein [Candidatus Sungbacteria bacterium]